MTALLQALDLRKSFGDHVVLRDIEDLTYEEIADVLGISMGTVRSRIFRAREAISQRVKPLLDKQSGKRW